VKAAHRRELKHDKFVDTVLGAVSQARRQLAPHRKVILGIGVAVLVVFVGYAAMEAVEERQSCSAWDDLEAQRAKEAKGEGEADYARLAQSYERNPSEPWLLYYSALDALDEVQEAGDDKGKSAARRKAITAFERLQTKYNGHPLSARSLALLAQQYADLGQWKRAADHYETVISSGSEYVDGFLKQKAKFGLAYTHEAQGNLQQAKERYRDLRSTGTSIWGDMARFRLERLSALGR